MCFALRLSAINQTTNNLNFSSWTKEDGLPSNIVYDVEKDELGFLWVATNDGLCRFNGPNSFKIYRPVEEEKREQETNSLKSSVIRSLKKDSDGFLWIGTIHGGLTKFDPSTNIWKTYVHNPANRNSLSNDEVLKVIEDSKKRIWVGTEDGLNLFDKETETFTWFKLDSANTHLETARAVLTVMEDKNGWIWAGTWAGGLHLLLEDEAGNFNTKNIRHFETTTDKAANNVWTIYQDKADRFWIGTHGGGVLLMDLPENANNKINLQDWNPVFNTYKFIINSSKVVSSNSIQAIHQDNNDDLWIGSCHGLFKVPGKNLSNKTTDKKELLTNYETFMPSNDDTSLIGDNILSIYEDDQGLLWFTSYDGFNQYNKYSNQFKNINFKDKDIEMAFTPSYIIDSLNNIWISSPLKGLVKYRFDNGLLEEIDNITSIILGNRVSTIHPLGKRWIYAGTEAGITKIDLQNFSTIKYAFPEWIKNEIQDIYILNILVDGLGHIWFATSQGLFRINSKTKMFSRFVPDKTDPHSINDKGVNTLIEDSRGRIWIATYRGLSRINDIEAKKIKFENFIYEKNATKKGPINNQVLFIKEINEYLYIGTNAGLCGYNFFTDNFETFDVTGYKFSIRSIEEGLNNDVWVSTSEGILNFNKEKKAYKIYDKKDGLGNTHYRIGSSVIDKQGNIYFGYSKGFTYFSPATFATNKIAPPVYISDIEISSKDTVRNINGINQKEIALNYDDYRLSIQYGAPNYNRADKNKYKHRLVGMSDNWIEDEFGTPIVYTNLESTEYQLEIMSRNNDGVWNEEASILTITKHPPYWETWWFRLVTLLLLGLLVFLIFKLYTQNVRKHNERLKGYNEKLTEYNENLNTEITNRKKIEQILQINNNELKRSNNDLQQFAYITAHDLKEPVHVITNFSNLLNKKYADQLNGEGSKFIDFILDGTNRMGKQIDSLLTYSIVGNTDSVYNKINLNQLIEKKLAALSLQIKEKNANVFVENLPEITGDEEQIGMVFTSLISNGLKFNKQETPTITIQVKEIDKYWEFSVRDNGIGIEPKYQDLIFGIFKRLHNRNKYDGTGIGLSICQKIILRHEGEIWLESKLDEGTTFFFTIKKKLAPSTQL